MSQCQECGMIVEEETYHPYAACLMFKSYPDGAVVEANLDAVIAYGVQAENERLTAQLVESQRALLNEQEVYAETNKALNHVTQELEESQNRCAMLLPFVSVLRGNIGNGAHAWSNRQIYKLKAQLEESQKRCAMQVSALAELSEFCKQPISVSGELTKKDVEFAISELLKYIVTTCDEQINATSADTDKFMREKINLSVAWAIPAKEFFSLDDPNGVRERKTVWNACCDEMLANLRASTEKKG